MRQQTLASQAVDGELAQRPPNSPWCNGPDFGMAVGVA